MDKLELYEAYTREEVSNIFNPETPFKPGTGTYGIHGLIRVPKENSNPDFIFFVNIGEKGFGHEFTEDITEDGKLNWESQPSQKLNNERIIQLINHNEEENNIFLFIRHGKDAKEYIYLGNLAYVSHDKTQEKPVQFVWQILQWSQKSIDKLKEIGIEVTSEEASEEIEDYNIPLLKVNPPENNFVKPESEFKLLGDNTKAYNPDYIALQKRKTEIGELGELLVLEREREYLLSNGRSDLAKKVNKLSDTNDRVGYDILSFDLNGSKKLIEVKTTTGGKSLGFHISANEVRVSIENSDNYYIYRVFDFNEEKNTGKFYVVNGSLRENFDLIPTEYKATYKAES